MNTGNLNQLLITEQLIEEVMNQGIGYFPIVDKLARNILQPNPSSRKNLIKQEVNTYKGKAELVSLKQTNIKKGELSSEEFKMSIDPYMIEYIESTLSGIRGLTNSTNEVITMLNRQYDTIVATELLSNKNVEIAPKIDGKDAITIAKRIVAMVNEVRINTDNAINTKEGSAIQILVSANIASALIFPTSSSQASSPMDFLTKGLANLGISEANISMTWGAQDNEVYVSNTNAVDLYTYGAPKIFKSGYDDRASSNWVQFIFSSVAVYMRKKGSLIYQVFNNVG